MWLVGTWVNSDFTRRTRCQRESGGTRRLKNLVDLWLQLAFLAAPMGGTPNILTNLYVKSCSPTGLVIKI